MTTHSLADPAPIGRLARPRSLAELVIHEIRELIVFGPLAFGDQLSESVLAEQFGVSRTPVREAFLRLETERLVEVRPQRGTFVFQYNEAELREICELREVLETGALHIAFARNRNLLIEQLEKAGSLTETAHVTKLGDYQSFDNAYHDTLIRLSKNEELIAASARISGRVRTIRYRLTRSFQQISDSQRGHREIVQALKDGRDGEAVSRLGLHLYNPYEVFPLEGEFERGGGASGPEGHT
jgi:DNA-binding GntR family transcriptional regulator